MLRLSSARGAGSARTLGLLITFVMMLVASVSYAQQTTSGIRGTVEDESGRPVANAPVIVTDGRTGSSRSLTTNSNGNFTVQGLRPGGPYSVAVSAGAYARQTVNDISLSLGDTYNFTVSLQDSSVEEVIVSGSAVATAQTALGPSSAFSLEDLQNAPAINRDIKDVIRIDPRIYIDEADVDSIQCAGANSRFNSLTVDGVRLNDNFGLNRNGYPTERIPFSFDAVEQIAVELAPFDVQYGGFTACNINAVTKSGSNEFHGSAFIDYTDDSLTGDSLNGEDITIAEFDESRYGFTLGGPIIKDKLFFFTAYEKLDGVNTFDRGPAGSGRGREVAGVSQAQIDEIAEIARTVYNYEPGGLPLALDNEDEKLLVKVDWDINDQHRASLTYNYNDGFNNSTADGDNNEIEFLNHHFVRGAEATSYSAQLFSSWTDRFSTEFRVALLDLDNRQIPLGGTEFGEVQIRTVNDADNDGVDSFATVYLGADDSRHANQLNYEQATYKLAGNYLWNDHSITFGYERDEFEVFNLFIQEAEGEYRFSSIDDFRNGTPNRITYENAAPSNNINDAAAQFGYEINTFYIQDEYTFPNSNFTLVAGLRYDGYTSSDRPTANPNFEQRYGFSNNETFDGEGLLQPRLGFNWDVSDAVSLHGGVGLYSGGNPNVWLSNNYSNNGITQVEIQDRTLDDGTGETLFTIPFNGNGQPIFDIPQELFDAVASGTADSGVNALDPGFDIPSEWKVSLGAVFDFDLPGGLGDGYTFSVDALWTRQQNAALIRDITAVQTGTAPDGRPIYSTIDFSDPDCGNPTSPDCSGRSQDFLLTNADGEGEQAVYSFALSKAYDWGLDWSFGYAYTEAADFNPMTSSVAFSNFTNFATSDFNNPQLAQSNYEIQNRLTLRLGFQRAFFGENLTKVTMFGTANEGRPFSYTFSDGGPFGDFAGFGRSGRQLLYVPTGPNDPNVNFTWSAAENAAFFNFLDESGLNRFAGEIAPRNGVRSDWWTKFDLRIEQELPGFTEGQKFATFLVIENLGNLLNDEWGVLREAGFPRFTQAVQADIVGDQYEYQSFFDPQAQGRETDASTWELRFGFRLDF